MLLTAFRCIAADESCSKEDEVKAGFLYNFTKFVEWPPSSFSNGTSPLVIGIFGSRTFASKLESFIENRKINGRPVVVKSVGTAEAAKEVHVLFLRAEHDNEIPATLAALGDSSVLTVGESEGFAKAGGTINLVRERDKIRFEINIGSAERHQLRISAQLQKLARVIRKSE